MPRIFFLSLVVLSWPAWGGACETNHALVARALARVRSSVDPCGESPQMLAVLRKLERCRSHFRICTDFHAERNSYDRPGESPGVDSVRSINWNPDLRTELEASCGAEQGRAVLRDPTASLLHELVHAEQDCEGLDPTEHEFEAVRIENIYRRANRLCQRAHYGNEPLPAQMVRLCEPGHCLCTSPVAPDLRRARNAPPDSTTSNAGDAASAEDPALSTSPNRSAD